MTSPSLRWLQLKRYRSLPKERIHFDNPTFLVGPNGSGKSNLVDAFPLLAEAMETPLAAVLDRRGGIQAVRNRPPRRGRAPNMGIGIGIRGLDGENGHARYAFELRARRDFGFEVLREQCIVRRGDGERSWFDRRKGRFDSSAESLRPAMEPEALALPLVGGDSRFRPVLRFLREMCCYRIEPARLRELQDPETGVQLQADGRNAASVLQRMRKESPEHWRQFLELLAVVVPTTEEVRARRHGNRVGLEFTQRWTEGRGLRFDGFSMSDGTLRLVGLLLAVLQEPAPTVLVIEEPEATIHPGALGTVLDLLRQAAAFTSVVVTTHSPDVLDAEWMSPDSLRIVHWNRGVTRIAPVSSGAAAVVREHLAGAGELLRANGLHPDPLFLKQPSHPTLFEPLDP